MAELLGLAERYKIPVRQIGRGESIEIAGIPIDVLWPVPTKAAVGSDNNSSLLMRMTHGENTFLFTGDIEREPEAALLADGASLTADIVKVPHHGSRTSSTEPFVNTVTPRLAVIPIGNRSMFGHPHPEVVERWRSIGAEVRTSGSKGTLSVFSDAEALSWSTFQP
jgi:competence protein ComEC